MERFSFASEAFVPRGDLLDRVTMAPLTAPHEEGQLIQAAIFASHLAVGSFGIPGPTRRSSPSWRGLEKRAGRTVSLRQSKQAKPSSCTRLTSTR